MTDKWLQVNRIRFDLSKYLSIEFCIPNYTDKMNQSRHISGGNDRPLPPNVLSVGRSCQSSLIPIVFSFLGPPHTMRLTRDAISPSCDFLAN